MIKIKVLSLFGGIETGLQALLELGIPIEEYHSFEILPAAIKVTQKIFRLLFITEMSEKPILPDLKALI